MRDVVKIKIWRGVCETSRSYLEIKLVVPAADTNAYLIMCTHLDRREGAVQITNGGLNCAFHVHILARHLLHHKHHHRINESTIQPVAGLTPIAQTKKL